MSQELLHHLGVEIHGILLLLQHIGHGFSGQGGDGSFQITYTGLHRIAFDDELDGIVREDQLVFLEIMFLQNLWNQMLLRDVQLLFIGVAVDFNDFHSVQKRSWYGIQRVCSGDEHDLGKVHLHFQIMVSECGVLLRIQHFQEGIRRVSSEVIGHLVDLIQKKQRISCLGLSHAVDDSAWDTAHIGSSVSPDFRFIPHATKGHAHEVSVHGSGYGLGDGCLTHPWRSYQTDDGSLHSLGGVLHCQVLDDSVLHILQPIVVRFQNLSGLDDVQIVFGFLVPWKIDEPVQIGSDDAAFRAVAAAVSETVQLIEGLLLGFLGHLGLLDLFLIGEELLGVFIILAQFILDGLQLLAKIVFLLHLVDVAFDLGADLLFDFRDFQFLVDDHQKLFQSFLDVKRHKKILLVLRFQHQVRCHRVAEPARVFYVIQRQKRFLGHIACMTHIGLKGILDASNQCLAFHIHFLLGLFINNGDAGLVMRVFLDGCDFPSGDAFHQNPYSVPWKLQKLPDDTECSDFQKIVFSGFFHSAFFLGHQKNLLVLQHCLIQCGNGFFSPYIEMQDHIWKYGDSS